MHLVGEPFWQLTPIEPGPAKVTVFAPALPEVMPPVTVSLPPTTWETVRSLLAVTSPVKDELVAVLPPIE